MTSHLESYSTTDVKLNMLSGVLSGKGMQHEEYNIRGIAHVHACRKEDIFMQR